MASLAAVSASARTTMLSTYIRQQSSALLSQANLRQYLPITPRHLLLPSISLPAISLNIPGLISEIWEGILKAVPKKKTSHMKKRHRQLAGKALKDVNSVNTCSSCGRPKKAHVLCPFCVTAHPVDIFSLAVTPTAVLSASGASSIKINATSEADFQTLQVLSGVHKVGCHHVATSANGTRAASVGFGGECKLWAYADGVWTEAGDIPDAKKAGELWAIALSEDGQYLAGTTYDGRISVWDLLGEKRKIREYETKGSFGLCIDLSLDGRFTASGHESGNIYIFNNDTGRLLHSLSGLVSRVRAVAFSPGGKILAAAGDARVIALYDVSSGEQVGILKGHGAWITSLDFSHTGEYLLSGSFDGKVKVWSIDRQECVATHSETDKGLWSVKWLPKIGRAEGFVTAGSNCSMSFYREAAGS